MRHGAACWPQGQALALVHPASLPVLRPPPLTQAWLRAELWLYLFISPSLCCHMSGGQCWSHVSMHSLLVRPPLHQPSPFRHSLSSVPVRETDGNKERSAWKEGVCILSQRLTLPGVVISTWHCQPARGGPSAESVWSWFGFQFRWNLSSSLQGFSHSMWLGGQGSSGKWARCCLQSPETEGASTVPSLQHQAGTIVTGSVWDVLGQVVGVSSRPPCKLQLMVVVVLQKTETCFVT